VSHSGGQSVTAADGDGPLVAGQGGIPLRDCRLLLRHQLIAELPHYLTTSRGRGEAEAAAAPARIPTMTTIAVADQELRRLVEFASDAAELADRRRDA
jgi:hypothetical protein